LKRNWRQWKGRQSGGKKIETIVKEEETEKEIQELENRQKMIITRWTT